MYRLDTSHNVFEYPSISSLNLLRYKLAADSGDTWFVGDNTDEKWAWIRSVDSSVVFGIPSIVKTIRYSPGHRDSGGASYYLRERQLASGFGFIYEWVEPNEVQYLRGCVIQNDSFGILTSVSGESPRFAANYNLFQNYPNPFNSITKISFSLPSESYVDISLFDILGREVVRVISGVRESGVHHVILDGSGLASGIYFVRFRTNDFDQTIRILLQR